MCGICGIVNIHEEDHVAENVLVRMRDCMSHRGPDDWGLYINKNVGLGFRRLSIIDLKYGHQPMCNEDGSVWIVFNGEIYNHDDIRKELISRGHIFRTRADTESIIHLYEEEGVRGIEKLNGMFAIALWDSQKAALVMARDRLGIKPLYYTFTENGIVFGSEIKAILENDTVKRGLNAGCLAEYLTFRYIANEKTLFENVVCLRPGHVLLFQNGKTTLRKYWDLPDSLDEAVISKDEAVNGLEELLKNSVKLRLMSDVPLGAFCSGGVDSSLVTAMASQQSDLRLNTFSVGFHESDYDESAFAKMVSEKYSTIHHPLRIDNAAFAESLPSLVWHNDEPLNHANSVQIYHISKLAKETVTVVLTGEGADELFAGYPRYLIARTCRNILTMPRVLRNLLGIAASLTPSRRMRKLGLFLPRDIDEIVVFNSFYVKQTLIRTILDIEYDYRQIIDSRISLLDTRAFSPDKMLDTLLYLELKTYLASILNRQDKMSMAAGIEARVPFLDHRLVEYGLRIPLKYKLTGLETKAVVKKLAERMLPREIVYRRKSGFGVPVPSWLRDKKGLGRYLELLSEPRFKQRGYFKPALVERLVAEHLAKRDDHSDILWELINLELWLRAFIDN
jgi:asparagine synthase (glutamine-hydrolysing)